MRNGLVMLALALGTQACATEEEYEGYGYRDEEVGRASSALTKCMGGVVGANDYCNDPLCRCLAGEGDCDTNAQCDQTTPSVCGLNNGAKYGRGTLEDVCWPTHCQNGTLDGDETTLDCGGSCGTACVCDTGVNGDPEFCTPSCKCSAGEGDCDAASDCDQTVASTCANDFGAKFGQDPLNDICVPTFCTDGVMSGDETGTDCGGSCGTCPSTSFGRANVDSAGNEANDRVQLFYDVSADGVWIVFASNATNLGSDMNATSDIFIHNRATGVTELISRSTAGVSGDGNSTIPSVSDDGRYVAFLTLATNLVAGDTNGVADVIVRDRSANVNYRASVATGGAQSNGASNFPTLSGNGQRVAFTSSATNLVAGDTNGADDIFISAFRSVNTVLGSRGTGGTPANGASVESSLDNNGRYLAFNSNASNLVTGDTNGRIDVFLYDRINNTTTLVSRSYDTMMQANSNSTSPRISGNGRYVVYRSFASNIVTGDTNSEWDIFRFDRTYSTNVRASLGAGGVEPTGTSIIGTADNGGNKVAFASLASNLVAGDTNGVTDIFVRTISTGTTVRIDSPLGQANGGSGSPVIAADGGFLIFRSGATNLVMGDANAVEDLFVGVVP